MIIFRLFLDVLMLAILIFVIFQTIDWIINWVIKFPYYSIKMKSWKKGYKYILNL